MKLWPWLGDGGATEQRRTDLWRLLEPRPMLDGAPSGALLKTEVTYFARIEHWTLSLNSTANISSYQVYSLISAR